MNKRGITLLELLVAMVISGILTAAMYRTFLSQQHTYSVQEQVSDMQQNARVAFQRMTKDIRMAGYGDLNAFFMSGNTWQGLRTYSSILTPGPTADDLTVVAAYEQVTTLNSVSPGNQLVTLASAAAFDNVPNSGRGFICFNGLETRKITNITPVSPGNVQVTLDSPLIEVHVAGESVYRVVAINYHLGIDGRLIRDCNTQEINHDEVLSDNIDSLQFQYVMRDQSVQNGSSLNNNQNPNDPLSCVNIQAVQVNLVARTEKADPQMQGGGFRQRQLNSTIQLRNPLTASNP